MAETLQFIQFGLGPIGLQTVGYLLERSNVELEAAIDIDAVKVGQDVGVLLGRSDPLGVRVSDRAEEVLASTAADVVVLATLSSFAALEEQIMLCLQYGKNVISSCEELAFPWTADSQRATRIDAAARAAGVTVLGSGVNPGFAMDALPLLLSSACRRVDAIHIGRHQDAALRRLPFQQKIGAGLSLETFAQQVENKRIRHVGFRESVGMIAHALGWQLERVSEEVKPAVAETDLASPFLQVKKGAAAGVLQTATGYLGDRPVITLELQAYLGHPRPRDFVSISGEPPLYSEVVGGFHGDIATCAMIANTVPLVRRAPAGLRTMLDVGLPSWFQGWRG